VDSAAPFILGPPVLPSIDAKLRIKVTASATKCTAIFINIRKTRLSEYLFIIFEFLEFAIQ
jgi:hypothetical protein